jgi:hypothetical protein
LLRSRYASPPAKTVAAIPAKMIVAVHS